MASRKTRRATLSGDDQSPGQAETGPAIRVGTDALLVGVRVSPSARRTVLRGLYGDRLKVAVSAPPEDNRANQALTEVLAAWLGLRREDVRIEAGHASRDKMVAFAGISEAQLRSKLARLLEADRR